MVPMEVPIAPPMTLTDLLGPVAPLLVLAVFVGFAALVTRIAITSWAVRRAPRPLGAAAWPGVTPHTIAAP